MVSSSSDTSRISVRGADCAFFVRGGNLRSASSVWSSPRPSCRPLVAAPVALCAREARLAIEFGAVEVGADGAWEGRWEDVTLGVER